MECDPATYDQRIFILWICYVFKKPRVGEGYIDFQPWLGTVLFCRNNTYLIRCLRVIGILVWVIFQGQLYKHKQICQCNFGLFIVLSNWFKNNILLLKLYLHRIRKMFAISFTFQSVLSRIRNQSCRSKSYTVSVI